MKQTEIGKGDYVQFRGNSGPMRGIVEEVSEKSMKLNLRGGIKKKASRISGKWQVTMRSRKGNIRRSEVFKIQ